ncbi:EmrB/QacA subfamily drug resistance transporter [Bacillus oleivorans]|uniref:EmrB/QacA subfamily drug resistance transporter n=1 Tax=Bacillus oleivorans TaxID=1448271 RepID=A0A285CTE0_9BACI|nr:MDR family MFS transporter [Bacillus oleivorans]SNX70774.1 EmrB/QacA subfamily drug resistance transporter [Bacillus oleivorans]
MQTGLRKITLSLLITTFLAAIEVTIISTAMPQIVDSLGGFTLMSWVFAIYLLTTSVSTPIWGKLSDLFGRKKIFMIGVTLFLIGSIACGLSQNMGQLIFFRAIQGLGAGAINPVTFTIIADVYNFEQRAKIQGLVSSVWAIAGIFGPLAGGFLVDFFTWRWIFFINLPFGLVSMWMIGKHFKENLEKKKRQIDYGGAVTFTIAITALLFALLSMNNEEGTGIALSHGQLIGLFGTALVFFVVFFLIQWKHPEPMMPLKLFQIKDVSISTAGAFLTSVILIGLTAYLPLWTQNVLGMGATSAGFTIMPLSLGWPVGAMLCSRLMSRFGTKNVVILGGSLIALGSFLLTLITPETSIWIIALIILVIGLGFGFTSTIFTVVTQSSVQKNNRGAAGSLNTLLRTLGQTIGVAIFGAALNLVIHSHNLNQANETAAIANGLHFVFVIAAIISVISLLVTFMIPNRQTEQYRH